MTLIRPGARSPRGVVVVRPIGDAFSIELRGTRQGICLYREEAIARAERLGRKMGCAGVTVEPWDWTEKRTTLPL